MVWCRATSLEQELDLSREKTTLLTRENQTLQQEVSEAFRLKVHPITLPDLHYCAFNLTIYIVIYATLFTVGTAASDLKHGLECDF